MVSLWKTNWFLLEWPLLRQTCISRDSQWFQGWPPTYRYSLNLAPESPDDYSNSRPADSAHADDWPVGFCDERIGDAQ